MNWLGFLHSFKVPTVPTLKVAEGAGFEAAELSLGGSSNQFPRVP